MIQYTMNLFGIVLAKRMLDVLTVLIDNEHTDYTMAISTDDD